MFKIKSIYAFAITGLLICPSIDAASNYKQSVRELQSAGLLKTDVTGSPNANVSRKELMILMSRMLNIIEKKDLEIEKVKEANASLLMMLEEVQETVESNEEEIETLDQADSLKVQVRGYFDTEYARKRSGQANGTSLHSASFDQHHTSLFFEAEKGDFKFFSEMEWEHSGTKKVQERSWMQWTKDDTFKIKAGQMLSPTYWNLNHYPNVALSINRPLLTRNFLPLQVTGLSILGSQVSDNKGWSYQAYIGNGSDQKTNGRDNDSTSSFGQKVMYSFDKLDLLDVTLHHYEDTRINDLDGNAIGAGKGEYEAWQWEVQAQLDNWGLLAAYAKSDIDDTTRLTGQVEASSWYVMPSFKLNERSRLYARFEEFDGDKSLVSGSDRDVTLYGYNYRPIPSVSLKLEYINRNYDTVGRPDDKEIWSAVSISF
ncbi:OprO/OprP family phosphate-selective porin [bacterium]|nr:OprO/OprP family phosphate-selective porin [bacterium]